MGIVQSVNANSLGGVPKYPLETINIGIEGVMEDKQNDLKYHGGPNRAVCIFSYERIKQLQSEGNSIYIGSTGENITIRGVDWDLLEVGSIINIGDIIIQLTGVAPPCKTIKKSFKEGKFNRISQKIYPGWSRWYASVLKKGIVNCGDVVILE
ncbi:MOSC domain-containing protein [Euryarchaeota archaeon]|mgnify:FL=1|nr:MOSC domain-containing protein [Euryarchaeota archaeon]